MGYVNPAPIIVLGNQRSGTSAVAHLLADYAGLSKTVDIPESWSPTLERLLSGELSLADFARRHRHYFSRELLKEPNLCFLFDQLQGLHPEAKYLFVVRDPRDNIRSILNRVGLSGKLGREGARGAGVPPAWRPVFDPLPWGLDPELEHPIEVLAARWNRVASLYSAPGVRMRLVRYEDFMADRAATIAALAAELDLPHRADVEPLLEVQYQLAGDNSNSWQEFFGANLALIEASCGAHSEPFGYELGGTRTASINAR